MSNIHAQLISPDRIIFDGEVRSVVIPGIEGDMTVMAGHQPVMTMLYPGIIFAIDAEGKSRRAFIQGGFAEITNTNITILAQDAVAFEEVTPELIDQEILRLQMARDATTDTIRRARADAAV